jgi:hypothetical protein
MSDLISASSLLMATIAVLFSLWYAEIIRVIKQQGTQHADDNLHLKKRIKTVFFTKSLPLTILSLAISLTFLPNVMAIIIESIDLIKKQGIPTLETYNAVNTAFCLVFIICLGLMFYTLALSGMLLNKLFHTK